MTNCWSSALEIAFAKDAIHRFFKENPDAASLTFQLPFDSVAESGVLTYITGSETDENTPEQPDLITPQTTSVETGSTFNYTAPGSSFGVLVVGV